MAYDPEARRQSNSALIIGLIALFVVGGGTLAYFMMRHDPEPAPTTIVTTPGRETVINNVPVPVPADNSTIIVAPPAIVTAPGTNTTTRIERNSTTVRTRDRVLTSPPASTGTTNSSAPAPSTNTNVTVNVPPASSTNSNTTPDTSSPAPAESSSSTSTNDAPASNSASGY